MGPSGENIYPEEIEMVINNMAGVDESLVLEKNGELVAMVKFDDNLLNWNQETEDQWFEKAEALKKSVLEFVNRTVGKNSKINKVEAMKEPFEKTATQKIRRFKYKDHQEEIDEAAEIAKEDMPKEALKDKSLEVPEKKTLDNKDTAKEQQ